MLIHISKLIKTSVSWKSKRILSSCSSDEKMYMKSAKPMSVNVAWKTSAPELGCESRNAHNMKLGMVITPLVTAHHPARFSFSFVSVVISPYIMGPHWTQPLQRSGRRAQGSSSAGRLAALNLEYCHLLVFHLLRSDLNPRAEWIASVVITRVPPRKVSTVGTSFMASQTHRGPRTVSSSISKATSGAGK